MNSVPIFKTNAQVNRFDFVHSLRGIAAISVVISHYLGVFWNANQEITDLIGVPRLKESVILDPLISIFAALSLIVGQFGVGIFFVLSGFVIFLAVERESRISFFIRRILRIYPVYIVGFLVTMGVLWGSAQLVGLPFKYSHEHVAIHALILVRGLTNFPRIDGISWTLEVELGFYFFIVIFGRAVLKCGLTGVFISLIAVLAVSLSFIVFWRNQGFFGVQVSCGLLLGSGVVYALHVRNRITTQALIFSQVVIVVTVCLVWVAISFALNLSIQWLFGYLLGMAIFATCYHLLRYRKISSSWLNFFGDISYPLYVVHGLFGYTVMYWVLIRTGFVYGAIIAAFVAACLVAYVLHLLVERTFVRLSRILTLT
jgi:peptidoglycan/LPS O-acetylase OafA/YrhL